MTRFQHDASRFCLACRRADRGGFDAMVHAVAQNMVQWRFQLAEDIAVYRHRTSHDFERDLLAQRPRQVANHARKGLGPFLKRPHPAADDLVVQFRTGPFRTPEGSFQTGRMLLQQFLRSQVQSPQVFPARCGGAVGGLTALDPFQQIGELSPSVGEGRQRLPHGLQPAGFDHRLAGQAHDAVEAAGGYRHGTRITGPFAAPLGSGRGRGGLHGLGRRWGRGHGGRGRVGRGVGTPGGGRHRLDRRRCRVRRRLASRRCRARRRRGGRGGGRHRLVQGGDQGLTRLLAGGQPAVQFVFRQFRQFLKDIHSPQQLVDPGGGQRFRPLLDGQQAIFHGVSQFDDGDPAPRSARRP